MTYLLGIALFFASLSHPAQKYQGGCGTQEPNHCTQPWR